MDKIQYVEKPLDRILVQKHSFWVDLSLPYFRSLVSAMLHLPEKRRDMIGEDWANSSFMASCSIDFILTGSHVLYHDPPALWIFLCLWPCIQVNYQWNTSCRHFGKDRKEVFYCGMFWNLVIGGVLIKINDEFNTEVMAVLLLSQAWLNSMLGILQHWVVWRNQNWINPMMLIREVTAAPIFQQSRTISAWSRAGLNHCCKITGWPFILLSFCSFCPGPWYLWLCHSSTGGKHIWRGGCDPCLFWALFWHCHPWYKPDHGFSLGLWSLSFGGYWAWDPVENTSIGCHGLCW